MVPMSLGEIAALAAACLVLLLAGCRLAKRLFSDEAKRERRRRRSHAPISSRAKHPMIKFSVRTKERRRK